MQAIFVVPLDEMGKLLSAIIEGLVVRQMTSSYFRLHVRVGRKDDRFSTC